jgi:hypothetical protein
MNVTSRLLSSSFESATRSSGSASQRSAWTADDCAFQGVVETTLSLEHAEDGQLYQGGKDEGWQRFGASSFEDPIWMFNLDFALAGGCKDEGDGGGLDAECYDACVDKGGYEAECEAACGGGDGKGDGGNGDDTIDEACFDARLDKGASEEECMAACADGK